ncbi:Alpha/beta hydrolase family-domain-containing protein [Aspergillus pseudotamarii]|uniref:Alpha/beta hydrolase family-domain-containing protein n=1 Tax=Aspergillus pseudotamarii TaxID=132259 RepID=A0A5N6SXD7_ASPPS|nr:Alpha/beta hydrolase family-domain-containing protein [Aspergillus pseudotamarii]KAE8139348.1 Alpha/beta hydrolase family-domain-containing protein [Aspergillus pseudotamarii]
MMCSASTGVDISATFKVIEHKFLGQHIREYPRATTTSQEDPLSIIAKQYVPWDNLDPSPGAISIISAHANGIPKEVYEPLWVEIYQAAKKMGLQLRGIWIADAAHQGASGILNEEKLGNDPSAFDHSRDLILMINQLRDKLPRPIFGIGHSMGATQLMNISLMHPRIFQGLCLVEPIVFPYSAKDQGRYPPAQASMRRRESFDSLDAARSQFRNSSTFQKWDSRAFDKWIKYGLRRAPGDRTGRVILTTTKSQELFTFVRPTFISKSPADRRLAFPDLSLEAPSDVLFYRPEPVITFHNLPHLRPSALYIFGGLSQFISRQLRDSIAHRTGVGIGGSGGSTKGQVKHIVVRDTGHFGPMEDPRTLAEKTVDWLKAEVEQWAFLEQSSLLNSNSQVSQEFLSSLAVSHQAGEQECRHHKL